MVKAVRQEVAERCKKVHFIVECRGKMWQSRALWREKREEKNRGLSKKVKIKCNDLYILCAVNFNHHHGGVSGGIPRKKRFGKVAARRGGGGDEKFAERRSILVEQDLCNEALFFVGLIF